MSLFLLVAFATAPGTLPAVPDTVTVPIREWNVPWEKTRPRGPAVAPDGKIFFVGQVGNYVARLDPTTGEFTRFEIDPGTNPHNVIVDARGNAWFAGNRNGMIGQLDPVTGKITRYPMPDPAVRDPHTIVIDPQGNLWFTAQNSNYVGHLNTTSGKILLVKMTTPDARPYGIVLDTEGRPYFDLFGTNKIGTIDPGTMELREYTLPYAMTSDDAGRLWFVETGAQPNRLVGFDPKTESFFSITAIPSGGGVVRYMVFDQKTRLIWFGSDNNTIGRVTVPPTKLTS